MKFGKKEFLAIIIAFYIVGGIFSCKKANEPLKNKNLPQTTSLKEKAPRIKKIVLIVNGDKFFDTDFIGYLQAIVGENYKELPEEALSALFDKFVEETRIYEYLLSLGTIFTQSEFQRYLKDLKVNPKNEDVRRAFYRKGTIEKYIANFIEKNINITEKDARRYYFKNLKEFYRPAEIRVSQILLTDEKEALKIRDYLSKHPNEFEKIAAEKSVGVEKNKGGDMGYFRKGELPKDIEDVVFSLDQGEISQVVRSPYGYHIFKVTRKKRKRLIAFKNVKDYIIMKLKQKQFNQKWNEFMKKVYSNTKVEIFPENLFFKYSSLKPQKNKMENKNEKKTVN